MQLPIIPKSGTFIEQDDIVVHPVEMPEIYWKPVPPINSYRWSNGLPCGVHTEIYEGTPEGQSWKVVRNNDGEYNSIWCMLNSGEWKYSPKFYWIVERMEELGWVRGSGSGINDFYQQALAEYDLLDPMLKPIPHVLSYTI